MLSIARAARSAAAFLVVLVLTFAAMPAFAATPSISINDVTTSEGNSGWHAVTFTVSLSAPASSQVSFYYTTSEISAVGNEDFQHAYSSIIYMDPGQTSMTLEMMVWGDTVVEPTETFKVDLIQVTGATVAKGTGIGTIVNDDTGGAATLLIADQQVTEGNSGSKTATFTVQLSKAASSAVSFNIATSNGTATAGSDYAALNLTAQSIPAGQTSKSFSVTITGDTSVENDETFTVNLSNASGAAITRGTAVGTITNDDNVNPVKIYVGDYYITEGNSGTQVINFPVELSQASSGTVTFDIKTEDGSATAPSDYIAKALTGQTIAAGQTLKNFSVTVNGDTLDEPEEHFVVTLSNVSGAAIWYGDTHGVGQIKNDDATISIGDATASEGDYGTTSISFPVTLSAPLDSAMMFRYQTCDGTATTADADYWGAGGPYYTQIGSGQTSTAISITINGDVKIEPNETFCVDLIDVQGAALGDTHAVGTIVNDDLPPPTASVGNASVAEGDTGQYPYLLFPLTFSHALQTAVTVHYQTIAGGSATPDVDYFGFGDTYVQINPGTTQYMLSVQVRGDYDLEPNETVQFKVLSIDGGVTLTNNTATGTIVNDDDGVPQPTLSVSDVTTNEGQPAVFTVTLSSAYSKPIDFDWSTQYFTADWGDYEDTSGHRTIPAGQTSVQVSIGTTNDGAVEGPEQFALNINNVVGASVGDSSALATIVDDDILTAPTLSIADVSITEGNTGTKTLTFVAKLNKPSSQDVTFWPWLQDETTQADSDYVSQSSMIFTIPAGQTSVNVPVTIKGDTVMEADETFRLNVGQSYGLIVDDAYAVGTILDDDSANAPTMSIADASALEGDNGQTMPVTFTATLSKTVAYDVTFTVNATEGTATANVDYYGGSPFNVTIPAGSLSKTFSVSTIGDITDESNETFTVTATNAVGAKPGDFQAIGTIVNDDVYPVVNISADQTMAEGNSGNSTMTFVVSLSQSSPRNIDFSINAGGGTAGMYNDYVPPSPSTVYTIPAGQTSINIPIQIVGDTQPELDESFDLLVVNLSNATYGRRQATGTILNDDGAMPLPSLTIAGGGGWEGDSGPQGRLFEVWLSTAAFQAVTVNYATADGSAIAGEDYVATSGTLTIPAGQTYAQIYVPVIGDTKVEEEENFSLNLSSPSGATIATGTGNYQIWNDDFPPPDISIGDVSVAEGGIRASFPITLSHAMQSQVCFDVAITPGTATAGADYTVASQTRYCVAAQNSSWSIDVGLVNDFVVEPDETFTVTLSNPSNGVIVDGQATGTILNDDVPGPILSVDDISIAEGNSGTKSATFTVSLSQAAASAVTFDAATSNGGAVAGSDYVALALTGVSIPAGTTSKTVSVTINGDTEVELDESFNLVLSNVVGANVADGSAICTILADDVDLPVLNVSDAQVVEDSGGSQTVMSFWVGLSKTWASDITVNVATTGGTATSGVDFTAKSEILTIPAGSPGVAYKVPVSNDSIVEADETFTLDLSNPVNATIADGHAVGTIVDNDPTISIGDVSILEGDSGGKSMVFTVSLSKPASSNVTFDIAAADGTATAGFDYFFTAQTGVAIAPGFTSKTIFVTVAGDMDFEPDETFTMNLSNVVGAAVLDGSATGTITNDDVASGPSLSIGDVTIAEGNSGTKTATFTVSLSAAAASTVSFDVASADGSATAGSDYVALSLAGQTIAAGQTSKTVSVTINGDTTVESDETFVLNVSNVVNASIADGSATGTITNDDSAGGGPSFSIGDVTVTEGNSLTKTATFTITLSAAQSGATFVDLATADGTATAGSDYVAKTQAGLRFAAGATSKTFAVTINGDTTSEPDENFTVNLSNPVGATIGDGQGVGTISNDDAASTPTLSIGDVTIAEGNAGTKMATFTVSLSAAAASTVSFDVATADGSATAGSDYVALSLAGQTIAAGQTSKTVSVTINGDTTVESDESFNVNVSNVSGATVADGSAIGTITNDDSNGAPTLSIGDVSIAEGNSGTKTATFTVSLSAAAASTVTFDVATANGSATAGSDYVALSLAGQSIAAGQTSKTVSVTINGDTDVESDEIFTVNVSNVVNATIADGSATGTITNDDTANGGPSFSIGDVTVTEGNSLTKTATFTITLSAAQSGPTFVDLATADGTATAGSDYVAKTQAGLRFAAGATSKTFAVTINGDTTSESDETFTVNLSNPVGASIGDGVGQGTITNDDAAATPTLSIADAIISEGNSGTKTLDFTVSLSAPAASDVTFSAKTVDVTATGGSDYVALPLTGMTIPAGQTSKIVSVTINGDTSQEAIETFNLVLSNVVNATAGDLTAEGTITNDDVEVTLRVDDTSVFEYNSGPNRFAQVTVWLSPTSSGTVSFDISTANGTATAGSDYVASTQHVTMTSNQDMAIVMFEIIPDTVAEAHETFTVNVTNVVGAVVGDGQGVVTITDDDGPGNPPSLSIGDISIAEGNSGTKTANFTVSLSSAAPNDVSFAFVTEDGTAISGEDYVASVQPNVTILAGQTSKTVSVTINGDTTVESDETFSAKLMTVSGASVTDGTAIATITNDDSAGGPTFSIGDVTVTEGNSLTKTATFTITLSAAQSGATFVDLATANGTATAGSDYVAKTQSGLRFAAGATSKTFAVTINGDTTSEPDETFTVNLSNPVGATIGDGVGVGTITNDDAVATPTMSIADASVSEGNSGTKNLTFTVQLSAPASTDVRFGASTADGTATAGSDYIAQSWSNLLVSPGTTTAFLSIPINGDTTVEPDETFNITLSGVSGATVADGSAVGTISNDDSAGGGTPTLSIGDVSIAEGNSGTKTAAFTVSLSAAAASTVSFDVASANGSATAGSDYVALSLAGQTIAAGQTSKTVSVTINGDTTVEPDENFTVNVSNVVNATIADGSATGTITNDDSAGGGPTFSIGDVTVTEGNSLTKTATFTITLSSAQSAATFIDVATANGTATAGSDYVAKTQAALRFPIGATSKTFAVTINGDTTAEPDESFTVNLSNPVGATIADGQGVGTITNDDAAALTLARFDARDLVDDVDDGNREPQVAPGEYATLLADGAATMCRRASDATVIAVEGVEHKQVLADLADAANAICTGKPRYLAVMADADSRGFLIAVPAKGELGTTVLNAPEVNSAAKSTTLSLFGPGHVQPVTVVLANGSSQALVQQLQRRAKAKPDEAIVLLGANAANGWLDLTQRDLGASKSPLPAERVLVNPALLRLYGKSAIELAPLPANQAPAQRVLLK